MYHHIFQVVHTHICIQQPAYLLHIHLVFTPVTTHLANIVTVNATVLQEALIHLVTKSDIQVRSIGAELVTFNQGMNLLRTSYYIVVVAQKPVMFKKFIFQGTQKSN